MNRKYSVGEHVYIIESGIHITEVVIVAIVNGFYQVCFKDRQGSLKLRESRLFKTINEAAEFESSAKKYMNATKKPGFRSPYDWE